MNIFRIIFFAVCIAASFHASAQLNHSGENIDETFQLARQKAFAGRGEEARILLITILEQQPQHQDARMLLARSYAWDKQYNQARQHLQKVKEHMPSNEEAIHARVDVEMWDEQFQAALIEVNKGLEYYSASEELLFKKSQILSLLNRFNEAVTTLDQLLVVNPEHEPGMFLKSQLASKQLKYNVGLKYSVDIFNRSFDPAHHASVQVSRINSWGTSIVRVNYANRFLMQGVQPELELYPKISKRIYAYVNYGGSTSVLFPKHRFGAEVYGTVSKKLEASIGLRHLYFESFNQATIYTGSVGWYINKYWVSFRPSLITNQIVSTYSSSLTIRRYFKNEETYLDFSASLGLLPDERRFQSGVTPEVSTYSLRSKSVGLTWQKVLPDNFLFRTGVEATYRELAFDLGEYVWIGSMMVSIQKKF